MSEWESRAPIQPDNPLPQLGGEPRVPPHDLSAEAAVISACLVDASAVDLAIPIVRPEDFYAESHRRIFEAIGDLHAKVKPADVVQVATWLRDHDRLLQIGGMSYLTEILNAAPAVAHVEVYAETVARKARVRRMQQTAQRIVAESYAAIADEDDWLDRAATKMHEVALSGSRHRAPIETMPSVLHRVFDKIDRDHQQASDGKCVGLPTGFARFDEATGGLHNGELTIVAARPGVGKTALAMNVVSTVAKTGIGVVVFSFEMPNEQIVSRALCSEAGLEERLLRTGQLSAKDWTAITHAACSLGEMKHVYLADRPCNLLDLRSYVRARQADMHRGGIRLGLVVVDFAQLMLGRSGVAHREEAVSENARGLKLLAKDVSCPVVVLSQLNRNVEARSDKRPMLSDLRESGALEEQGDVIVGMYRDDYYNARSKRPGVCELILLKHRHGPTGTVEVGFHGPTTRFFDLPHEERDEASTALAPPQRAANGMAPRDWHDDA
jgi:replicative DNA helicase